MNFAMKAVQRTAVVPKQTLVLLGPDDSTATANRAQMLSKMQRFRGSAYLKDGAIHSSALDSEGRHCVESDSQSWHVLAVDSHGDVCGCSRYTSYQNYFDFDRLSVGRSALAQSDVWAPRLRAAIEGEQRVAWRREASFVEVGGWAIAEHLRGTTEALRIALATYALADCLGGCIGVTTATVRHHSANILRKIGGRPLAADDIELPRYYDPQYECEMEILRFDSSDPNPKFVPWIQQIRAEIEDLPVLARHLRYKQPPVEETSGDFGGGLQLAYGW